MRLSLLLAMPWLAGWGERPLPLPYAGPMPDEARGAAVSPYTPVTRGIKTFTPVDPVPWGEVNKRVMPSDKSMPATPGMEHKP